MSNASIKTNLIDHYIVMSQDCSTVPCLVVYHKVYPENFAYSGKTLEARLWDVPECNYFYL